MNRRELMKETALGSARFGSVVDPGKTPWNRGPGGRKGKSRTGIQPRPSDGIGHDDAIYALRTSGMIAQPEVRTPELMAEYRKLRNLYKRLRRALRA